jgi:tetratricopeptide (TPR) repeat protein
VLQEHLTGPEVLVKQVQFLARTGDEDGAVRAFADLCQTPGDGPPVFIQLALAELTSAGLGKRAAETLEAAWQADEFNPWAGIYWLDTPHGQDADPGRRLAACEAVVKAYPAFVPGYDRRAEQLAEMGRFSDAIAGCFPPGLAEQPVPLQGRAAWVLAKKGDKPAAIDAMKEVLGNEPDYLWGWRQLTQWYDALGRKRDCLHAADQLVRLSPRDPLAHAIRGEARRAVGDHRGARDDFARAFDLDPEFEAAGLQLVSAYLATDDLDGATAALDKLADRAFGPLVAARRVQVSARRGDLAAARDGLRALATDPAAPKAVLREAVDALVEAGWAAEAGDELGFAVLSPDGTAAAAGLWVERLAEAGKAAVAADALAGLAERNPVAGREAVLAYADAMKGPEVAATVQRFADVLRADTAGWGRAGAALVGAKQFALAAAWLGDWKARGDAVEPWMLVPLADSLRAIDRDADMLAVCRGALALGGAADGPADFRAWLALAFAVEGNAVLAAEHLAAVDAVGRPDGVRLVLALADALVKVQQAPPAGKRAAFADAQEAIRVAAGACAADDRPPGVGRWYRRAVARLAADAGGLAAGLWALGQRVRPWVRAG